MSSSLPNGQLKSVLLIYNTDYDTELTAEADVDISAVEEAARAVCRGIADFGLDVEILGIHGDDIGSVVGTLQSTPQQLVFNIVESLCGDTRNEQVMPALLDLLQQPYTGPDAITIGLCLHKVQCKHILLSQGIATPEFVLLDSVDQLKRGVLDEQLDALQYPYFLKLAREDASIGIKASNRVTNREALTNRALELWETYGQPVLAERYIAGREINVTVLGTGHALEVLPLHEIDFGDMPKDRPHIVSYAAKWDESHVDYEGTKPVPVENLSEKLDRDIRNVAKQAFAALGLRDFGRVDLRVDANGRPWVIDVNPNCDLSPDAGVAKAAARAGMGYSQLIGKICRLAWDRQTKPPGQPCH